MSKENEPISYKKRITLGKIFLYYFIIQIIILIIGGLTFLTGNISPYNDDFKNKWNQNYIAGNNEYAKDMISNYNIEISKVTSCESRGFYEKNNLLYFCDNNNIYIFQTPKNLNELFNEKKEQIITYIIYTTIFSIIGLFFMGITNRTLFTTGSGIGGLSQGVKELESVIEEHKEYIENNGNRLEYRLPTLKSLALSVIETEIDFFNRYGDKIKKLSELAKEKNLNIVSDELYILYKEMEKKYFIKKKKIFHALGSELSLLLTKYNTSLLGFFIFNIFAFIINIYILLLLYAINGNQLSIINSINTITSIMTLRGSDLITYNIYQNIYIVFLHIYSYIILLTSIKLIANKR